MSALFDFDALDEAYEELERKGVQEKCIVQGHKVQALCTFSDALLDSVETVLSEGFGHREEGDDALSEIWPDDVPDDLGALRDKCGACAKAEGVSHADGSAELNVADGGTAAWEVVFTRVVARAGPAFDAPVVAVFSKGEVVFEEAGSTDDKWVKLYCRHAFILKDGRVRDPSLGELLRPYAFPETPVVPERHKPRILCAMRTAWVQAQAGSDFLKPPEIRRLRRAEEQALLRAAAPGAPGGFDVAAFEAAFKEEVERLTAEVTGRPSAAGRAESIGGKGLSYRKYNGSVVGRAHHMPFSRARNLLYDMENRCLPSVEEVREILQSVTAMCSSLPSLVHVHVPQGAKMHVVGDLHGQFWDLLHIIQMCGEPSPTNQYLFNGDLVDRGQFSTEVAIGVLYMKQQLPYCVHVNRGNHESFHMNWLFGFQAEVKIKYNEEIFDMFCHAFRALPVATVINNSVFVVHGGLSSQTDLRLSQVAALRRDREPDCPGDLLVDLLWSDPFEYQGIGRSQRGCGVLFGPDVTRHFCELNGLACIIRSHEVKLQGYEWAHEGRCLTVFSAANYCGTCGNDGAVCDITQRFGTTRIGLNDLQLRPFPPNDHPVERSGPIARFGYFC